LPTLTTISTQKKPVTALAQTKDTSGNDVLLLGFLDGSMQVYSLPAMQPLLVLHSSTWSHTKQINCILAGGQLPDRTFFTASDDARMVGFKIEADMTTQQWPDDGSGGGGGGGGGGQQWSGGGGQGW
jgi:uncharacterized membrane protein YgcG